MTVLLHDRKMIYLRPAKTGSSTIRHTIMSLDENNENLRAYDIKYTHMQWWEVRDYVGTDVWNEYSKIGSVRNPWDLLVSQYYYHIENERIHSSKKTFEHFVYETNLWVDMSPGPILFDDETLLISDVIKMESIKKDIKRIFNVDTDLHRNKGVVRPSVKYKEMYNDKMVEHVYDVCYREIEAFGYEY